MPGHVNFIFAVHCHQPVGNFDHVFEMSCDDSYQPFLNLMAEHPSIKFCAHFSGPILEWIEHNRVDILMKIREMVDGGRLEILGGGMYEPIFSMLNERDIAGQIETMNEYLSRNFSVEPRGIWIPERIWEQHLVKTLAGAGVRYSLLDDFHFKAAGMTDESLCGHFITEDEGKLMNIFPMSEQLRYSIPFKEPEWTIDYLRSFAGKGEDPIVVYADDGEKFGVWPRTFKHVFEDGWLNKFLTLLDQNGDWLKTITFSEAIERIPSLGKIYLPSCSYREMGEWSMLSPGRRGYDRSLESAKQRMEYDAVKHFMPGGNWRNFKVKYPEANAMYGRMLMVSNAVNAMAKRDQAYASAAAELYKAQCNCAYWHGVFGGVYFPFLRDAIYRHLIEAENIVRETAQPKTSFPHHEAVDLDLDGNAEIRLTNSAINLFLSPVKGGELLELDLRVKNVNLLNSMTRRFEAYHESLKSLPKSANGSEGAVSIHDLSLSNAGEVEKCRIYDPYRKASLIDHFYRTGTRLAEIVRSEGEERGDFVERPYSCEIAKSGGRINATMKRNGAVVADSGETVPLLLTKNLSIDPDKAEFTVVYTLKNAGRSLLQTIFGVEMNIAAMCPGMEKSFYHTGNRNPVASMLSEMEFADLGHLGLCNTILKLNVGLVFSSPPEIWVHPVRTISRSESGFDLIYQASTVIPHWPMSLDAGKSWEVVMTLKAEES